MGRVVEVVRGRDAGELAVVIAREASRFVWIADGSKRRVEKPKKKNALHLRNTPILSQEVAAELANHGKVTNALLRHTLKQAHAALCRSQEELNEGGDSNGQGRRD